MKGIKVVRKPNGRRFVYRRIKGRLFPLPDLPENDPRFLRAYLEAGERAESEPTPVRKSRARPGSIGELCLLYAASGEFRRLAPSTMLVRRRVLDRIAHDRGEGLLRDLRPEHIRKDVRALSPGAASNRLKAWRGMMRFALDEGLILADPTAGVRPPRGNVTPHRQWTADEIAAFRDHWPHGTPQRTALEVIFWTGARCVDAVGLGWQGVRDGWLSYTQAKTGGPATCPITAALPMWSRSLAADQAHFLAEIPGDRMLWITSRTGAPRSVKGLSQWLSAAASAAGLPDDCTAHGLRKARAAALAEAGATAHQIGAWTGHASLSEIAHYTRGADQRVVLMGTSRERKSGNRPGKVSKRKEKDQ